jgi:transcriptional regulator with XRE-family HTH domain
MPVFSSHLLEYPQLRVGERIREARQHSGLTLKQLADRLGTSTARMSQVENDRVRLDVAELLDVASALALPLDRFVPPDVSVPYQIVRDSELRRESPHPTVLAGPDGAAVTSPHQYWPLADLFVGRHLEPMLGRIMPVDEHDLHYCYHQEEEFAFVLRGTIEFRIRTPDGEQREQLARGDCVYFRSDLPHCFRSLDRDAAESIHVFCPPAVSGGAGGDGASYRAVACKDGNGATDVQRRIGDKLRLLREIHGWSLERVGRATGLTERHVSRIERSEGGVPFEVVMKLARAFGKPLREFIGLAGTRGPYYFIQRSRDIAAIQSVRRRTPVERPNAAPSKTCHPLVSGFPAKEMYPYFLRLLNVDIETLTHHEHHGQEFIYVLEGELELTTYSAAQQGPEILRAGDACYLDSTVPHLLRSWTRNPYSETSAEVIDVFWCPLGEDYLFQR